MFVNSEGLGNSGDKPHMIPTSDLGFTKQFRIDVIDDNYALNKLCALFIGSKSTQIVKKNKYMTPTTNKFEEMYADLWGPYDLFF